MPNLYNLCVFLMLRVLKKAKKNIILSHCQHPDEKIWCATDTSAGIILCLMRVSSKWVQFKRNKTKVISELWHFMRVNIKWDESLSKRTQQGNVFSECTLRTQRGKYFREEWSWSSRQETTDQDSTQGILNHCIENIWQGWQGLKRCVDDCRK